MIEVETSVQPVELVGNCASGSCLEFAWNLHRAVEDPRYQVGASIMPCPVSLSDWRSMHRTARKRADRCERLGYRFAEVDYSKFADDIFEINTSKETRQGRPMSSSYREYVERSKLPEFPCARHKTFTYGVLQDGRLRAYLTLHRSGDLLLISQILGDGNHLRDDIMFLLFQGLVEDQSASGGLVYYNRWDSGRDGLRFYKQRVGLAEGDVRWIL